MRAIDPPPRWTCEHAQLIGRSQGECVLQEKCVCCRMPPKKRVTFDPEAAKIAAKRMKESNELLGELENSAQSLLTLMSSAGDIKLSSATERVNELFLVATLGLENVLKLHTAMNMVPNNFCSKIDVVTSMLNYALPPDTKEITTKQCSEMSNLLSLTSLSKIVQADSKILEDFSNSTGKPTIFLTPPVEACINGSCPLFQQKNSLIKHHDPIIVTLHSFEGPKPGLKQSLKCKSCYFIYNYSKYGKKHSIGEKFYQSARKYVEASDTVFCDRKLHEMFCHLR